MKWTKEDITTFTPHKEYIDTLIVPIMPIDLKWNEDSAACKEQLEHVVIFVEQQLKGRAFVLPIVPILDGISHESVNRWQEEGESAGYRYVQCITVVRGFGVQTAQTILPLPYINVEGLSEEQRPQFLRQQADELISHIEKLWIVEK
ncbi:MAG: DUF2487 family protein [Bacilli bacterium]